MIETLTQIYNVLSGIDTHGDGTLRMASCLNALAEIINANTPRPEEVEQLEVEEVDE